MDIVAFLRRIPLFSSLDDEVLSLLGARCVQRTVGPGVVLFATGEPYRGLYMVASGRVRVYRVSGDGREQVLHMEGAGRTVAELPLFDGGPYPASAITVEESRLVFLPRADFEQVYRTNPDFAHSIIQSLGKRLRHFVHVTETLAFRDVASRLALLLAGYADQAGRATPNGIEISLGRTREEIALEIGAARESVSRAFKQLHVKGVIIILDRQRLLIPDLVRLRTLAAPGARARG